MNNKKSLLYESTIIMSALFIMLLYFVLSNLWVWQSPFWRYDDPMLLQQIATTHSSVAKVFYDLEFWQDWGRFMPLPAFLFILNYKLGGLNASFFYYNHLIVIYLISCATFIWLRPLIGNTGALLAGLLFLAGIPTFIVANQIMSYPYALGLFFIVLFLVSCEKIESSVFCRWTGAIFLLLASMTHETFIAFLLYPLLKQTHIPLSRRLSSMIPAIICMAFFIIWRTIILKGIGGYGYPVESAWRSFFGFFLSIGKVYFGEGWLALCTIFSIMSVLIITVLIYKNRLILNPILKITGGVFITIVIFLPAILALRNSPQQEYANFTYHRYLFVSWWAFSCFLTTLPYSATSENKNCFKDWRKPDRWGNGMIVLFALLAIMFLSIQNQRNHLFHASKTSFDNLYRYAIGRGAGSILSFPDKNAFWYYDLQLKSLADVYLRPRLYLEYKNTDATMQKENDYVRLIFDPSCTCFKNIK